MGKLEREGLTNSSYRVREPGLQLGLEGRVSTLYLRNGSPQGLSLEEGSGGGISASL